MVVLAFQWHPLIKDPPIATGFNNAYRRILLPDEDFALGECETDFAAKFMANPVASTAFPLDHSRPRRCLEAIYLHWCNGRLTGSFIARRAEGGYGKTLKHARHTAFRRVNRIVKLCAGHPLARELPKGSMRRVRILAAAHAAGAVFGGLFGAGRALWALE